MTKCTAACDAEKAVLVKALHENAITFHATHSGLPAAPFKTCMDAMCASNRAVLADTSPAAAALLAQGERLWEFLRTTLAADDCWETGDSVRGCSKCWACRAYVLVYGTNLEGGRRFAALSGEEK